jgi:hypothetical protein
MTPDISGAVARLRLSPAAAAKGDPNVGENSALFAALGYVREDDRASGLQRHVVPVTPESLSA